MTKVTMFWHGGSSYAVPDVHDEDDAEVFRSIGAAVDEFKRRTLPSATYYPCVDRVPPDDGGPEAWLFFGDDHPVIGQEYPDKIVRFGPRGGAHVEDA